MGLGSSLKKIAKPFVSMATLGLTGSGDDGGADDGQASAQAAARKKQRKAIAAVNRVFADTARRDANYSTAGNDILNLKMPQLEKQRTGAARMLKFALARNGQTGGSVALDQGAELTDNYQRGVLDLQNERQRAINTMRASDDESRINLIGQIRAGMSQATALQAAQAKTNSAINQARDSALAQSVQDYFGGMSYLNQQAQQQRGYDERMARLRSAMPSASNGTIARTY